MDGDLFFAVVGSGVPFDPDTHDVEDFDVFSLRISQSEGEFARAELEIENPKEGLLSGDRWIHISIEKDGVAELIFSGRMIGHPSEFSGEVITLEYIAQPDDFETIKNDFLDTLKVSPFYNVLFSPEENRDDVDEVLAARSALLHCHRATHALSLSDIIEGSYILDFEDNFLHDSLRVQIGDPPVQKINLAIEVQWEQIGKGEVQAINLIKEGFPNTKIATPQINTLTPDAFEKGWAGARIPSGYSLKQSKLYAISDEFGLLAAHLRSGLATVQASVFPRFNGNTTGTRQASVPRVWYDGEFTLDAFYNQKRREVFRATIESKIQQISEISNMPEDINIILQTPTDTKQGSILDESLPSFFYDKDTGDLSTFGREAIEHGLRMCMARLVRAARAVEISFSTPIDIGLEVTCDHSIRVEDERIFGGSALGKVISYEFSWDGGTGESVANFTVGICIGTGEDSEGSGSLTEVELEQGSYVSEFVTGSVNSGLFYDFNSPPLLLEPVDVALMESDPEYLIDSVVVTAGGEEQNEEFIDTDRPDLYLKGNPTLVTINLKSMRPESELFMDVEVETFEVTLPKNIDLEGV